MNERASAFTVAELGDMLEDGMELSQRMASGQWWVTYGRVTEDGEFEKPIGQKGDTEADARAKMLVYLIENNLLTS
jgi:hypothetical protein